MSVTGTSSNWSASGGPPRSRAMSATTAARLPPADSPPTAIRVGSMPSRPAFAASQREGRVAVLRPRSGTGTRARAGTRRSTTTHPAARQMCAHLASLTSESIVPKTNPPPWKWTNAGCGACTGGREQADAGSRLRRPGLARRVSRPRRSTTTPRRRSSRSSSSRSGQRVVAASGSDADARRGSLPSRGATVSPEQASQFGVRLELVGNFRRA